MIRLHGPHYDFAATQFGQGHCAAQTSAANSVSNQPVAILF